MVTLVLYAYTLSTPRCMYAIITRSVIVCVYMYMYIYIYIYIYADTHTHTGYMSAYTHNIYVYTYIYIYIYIYIHTQTYTRTHTHTHAHTHTHENWTTLHTDIDYLVGISQTCGRSIPFAYVCMYVCTYVCMHADLSREGSVSQHTKMWVRIVQRHKRYSEETQKV